MSSSVLSKQYQRKSDIQHILENQETYIGSTERLESRQWVLGTGTGTGTGPAMREEGEEEEEEEKEKEEDAGAGDGAGGGPIMRLRTIEYVPALFKLFDEALVNCRDHVKRMITKMAGAETAAEGDRHVTYIEVDMRAADTGVWATEGRLEFSFKNDGNGIDVARHPEYGVWIPQLIFAEPRTSTNYGGTGAGEAREERMVGGKNGVGAKVAVIWSTRARLETVDGVRGLRYVQEFRDNLSAIGDPVVTKVSKSEARQPFTKFSFVPDYDRMRLPTGVSRDMAAMMQRRVYDVAAVTDHSARKVRVALNGETLAVRGFAQYLDMYLGPKDAGAGARVFEQSGERWEYGVALSRTGQFECRSFVNGIDTAKGGKHVDYILGQLTRKLIAAAEKKKKKVALTASALREQLFLFLRCDIVNPTFDSQSKETLSTPATKFGSSCVVSDAFVEKVCRLGVLDTAASIVEAKDLSRAKRKTDGAKVRTLRGIENLVDANWSGTKESHRCRLFLCEGLSAQTGVLSGLSSEDRNVVGIYPLKGKVLNVRGETRAKIAANREIAELMKILGLEIGRVYGSREEAHAHLRYGQVVILTDQDLDGSHIKGLIINLFHAEWPSLLKLPGFLGFMNTPILRARGGPRGDAVLSFYSQGEYEAWKQQQQQQQQSAGAGAGAGAWSVKYFKGLGTSTAREFKEYFADPKIVHFSYTAAAAAAAPSPSPSEDAIDKVFNKKRASDRKSWLEAYRHGAFPDSAQRWVSYETFVDRELIEFSKYDCARSIPGVDGLKISQRKILYCVFKRNLRREIKVAQLTGYVSEHSAYHHGEASLAGAIVNMAQQFVGANNVNLLEPNGQFGTRQHGGSDCASARYIFTALNPLARFLFRAEDDAALVPQEDDGVAVEPVHYAPILPLVLLNGAAGIGTGFSSFVPSFDPLRVLAYLRARLRGGEQDVDATFVPFYEGFLGRVEAVPGESQRFRAVGVYRQVREDAVEITELPVGTWTMPYLTFLDSLADGATPVIREVVSLCTEQDVRITVTFARGELARLQQLPLSGGLDGVEKLLRLSSAISTSNMHLFDAEGALVHFKSAAEIVDAYIPMRRAVYARRKELQLGALESKRRRAANRGRFVEAIAAGTLVLQGKSAAQIERDLAAAGFERDGAAAAAAAAAGAEADNERERDGAGGAEGSQEREESEDGGGTGFEYLTNMRIMSLSAEKTRALLRERDGLVEAMRALQASSVDEIWLRELAEFETEFLRFRARRAAANAATPATPASQPGRQPASRKKPKL